MISYSRARGLRLAIGLAAVCLLMVSPAAHADVPGWSDGYGYIGHGEIDADHKSATVCDIKDDDLRVGVEYHIAFGPFHKTTLLQAGPRRGCTDDSVWLGTITSAMFCYGYDLNAGPGSLRWCNDPAHL